MPQSWTVLTCLMALVLHLACAGTVPDTCSMLQLSALKVQPPVLSMAVGQNLSEVAAVVCCERDGVPLVDISWIEVAMPIYVIEEDSPRKISETRPWSDKLPNFVFFSRTDTRFLGIATTLLRLSSA